jgi:hypothetical protein
MQLYEITRSFLILFVQKVNEFFLRHFLMVEARSHSIAAEDRKPVILIRAKLPAI